MLGRDNLEQPGHLLIGFLDTISSFFTHTLDFISVTEVCKILKDVETSKASGPNGISWKERQMLSADLCVTYLTDLSLAEMF